MLIARQSTARTVTVGPVLDADGVAVTGGVVGDFKIAVNGAAPAALNGSATATHRHTGFYSLALTATDLATVGTAEITIDDTVNAMPMKEISVIEEAIYDAYYAASATGLLPANVTQWLGQAAAAVTNNGVPEVDITHIGGVAVSASTAQLGVNLVNIAGAAVSTSTAQLGVNVVNFGGERGCQRHRVEGGGRVCGRCVERRDGRHHQRNTGWVTRHHHGLRRGHGHGDPWWRVDRGDTDWHTDVHHLRFGAGL
jgi:hypothetical protein